MEAYSHEIVIAPYFQKYHQYSEASEIRTNCLSRAFNSSEHKVFKASLLCQYNKISMLVSLLVQGFQHNSEDYKFFFSPKTVFSRIPNQIWKHAFCASPSGIAANALSSATLLLKTDEVTVILDVSLKFWELLRAPKMNL